MRIEWAQAEIGSSAAEHEQISTGWGPSGVLQTCSLKIWW